MPDLRLRHQGIGEVLHGIRRAAQRDRLQAVVVVQVDVHGRQHQIVVLMLQVRQPFGEIAGVVVVDVTQRGYAIRGLVTFQALRTQQAAQDVAHRLGPVLVALAPDQFVEAGGEFLAERNREAFHV